LLTAYLTQTRALLQLPGTASTSLYSDTDLTRYINLARGQMSIEPQNSCIRSLGTISTVIGQQPYLFAGINTGVSATTGIAGVMNIRSLSYAVPGSNGALWMSPRTWPWFSLYELNNVVPDSGPPRSWAQFAQGAGGSFYVSPLPDLAYVLSCNAVCYPIPLVDDTTVEAIPYPWTDCIPFFAAYWALLSSQTQARMADALNYYKMYEEFSDRARKASNPDTLRWMYQQSGDPAQGPKMSIGKAGANG
jgi:hypothetical protein